MSDLYLVIGPPGCGKTRYLTRQAAIAAEKYGPSSVVITSMTKAASHEIASRTPGIPEENIGTLHAHAYRALDRPDLAETPEARREWNGRHPALELTGAGQPLEDAPSEDAGRTEADQLHSAMLNHRARLTPVDQWLPQEQEYLALWDEFKESTGRLDFTDLIERALASVPQHPGLPTVLLLDEAQDFSRLELQLALQWAAGTESTVIVGDPDQTLYTWRGSDHDALQALPVTDTRILEQSYRVPRAVHDLAVNWVRQIPGRKDITYHPTAQAGTARRLPISLRRPNELLAAIGDDLQADRTVMVLTTCGYMLAPVISELRRNGIPFHNPYRAKQGAWNPMRGAGALLAFLRPIEAVWGTAARAWTWDDLRRWTDPLRSQGVLQRGAKKLIEQKCRPDTFGKDRADMEVPTETLLELLGDPGTMTHPALCNDVDWFERNLLASKAQVSAYPLDVYRSSGGRALIDDPAVIVGTIHSVKGGEADSVYVFPDLSKQGFWHGWHAGGADRDQIVRMFYVALTRARDQVTVLDPATPEHVPLELLTPATAAEAIAA